jgi:hypothetical protein
MKTQNPPTSLLASALLLLAAALVGCDGAAPADAPPAGQNHAAISVEDHLGTSRSLQWTHEALNDGVVHKMALVDGVPVLFAAEADGSFAQAWVEGKDAQGKMTLRINGDAMWEVDNGLDMKFASPDTEFEMLDIEAVRFDPIVMLVLMKGHDQLAPRAVSELETTQAGLKIQTGKPGSGSMTCDPGCPACCATKDMACCCHDGSCAIGDGWCWCGPLPGGYMSTLALKSGSTATMYFK